MKSTGRRTALSAVDSKEAGGLQLCHVYDTLKSLKSITPKKDRGNESADGGAPENKPPASGSNDMLELKVPVISLVLTNFFLRPKRCEVAASS